MADGPITATRGARFEEDEARLLLAIAEAATPGGVHVRAPSSETVRAVERVIGKLGPDGLEGYVALLRAFDLATLPTHGARFQALSREQQAAALTSMAASPATYTLARLATGPIKLAQVTHPDLPASIGSRVGLDLAPPREEPHPWGERLFDAGTLDEGETFEVDAVVVGSGAGGAPVAHGLASRGHAVLVLEAGPHLTRRNFVGRPSDRGIAYQQTHLSLGNAAIVLPTGSTVGGTTTINSGTCFRTPPEILRSWRFDHGLRDLDPETMAPHFERVEAMLGIAPNEHRYLGKIADIVARGASALGLEHGALPRNAPDCDGQGVCCFGCPTDAKRSTNVSYIPAALERGAMLGTHARVEEILIAGGRAVGVVARAAHGKRARFRVFAKAVVLSCGTLRTPLLLARQGLATSSGQVGRNLTMHPCSNAFALMSDRVEGWVGVPQGYGVDSYAHEGLRFEGASVPLDIAAAALPLLGSEWTRFVDAFDRIAQFGFMSAETSRGRVVAGPMGRPQMLYNVNDFDRRRIVRGHAILARIFLAAGAEQVWVGIQGVPALRTAADADALERSADSIGAHRLDLSAFHPLGTCRMGADPRRSVVSGTHEAHDVPGLFVVDGSAVNGPLGVNPQVTIMALAERATTYVERRIENPMASITARSTALTAPARVLEFTETMGGRCTFVADRREAETSFTVRCFTEDPSGLFRDLPTPKGGVLTLEGTATVDGLATRKPCHGTLAMHPRKRRGTLIYDLDFVGDDGAAFHLHGEKSVPLLSVLTGMTTLDTEIERADGVPVARGTLRFDLRDLLPWLGTFRLRRLEA